MSLNNTEIRYYDSNVLRLPADKRKKYHEQVDRLVTELSNRLHDQTEIKITKVVKAGSFAKFTILRKSSEDPVDVDVVIYISGRNVDKETLASLSQLIYDTLVKLYPNKAVEDFEIQRKAATVTFVGSGLSVDIVPVIEDPSRPGYGWQFDIHDNSKVQTCAPCQIKFVRDRKDELDGFGRLVADAPHVAKGPAVIRNSVIRAWVDSVGPVETVRRAGLQSVDSLRLPARDIKALS